MKAIRYFDRYTHQGKFKPFLYRTAANTCADMRRKYCRPDISLEESAIDPGYVEQAFDAIQSDMALRQLVSGLPPGQREIVLLRFGQELTFREIAEAVKLPLRTVQSRLRSALKRPKREMAPPEEKSSHKSRRSAGKEATHEK